MAMTPDISRLLTWLGDEAYDHEGRKVFAVIYERSYRRWMLYRFFEYRGKAKLKSKEAVESRRAGVLYAERLAMSAWRDGNPSEG